MASRQMGLIIILGAGKGISKSVARKFGKEGYKVVLVSRSESKLEEITRELNVEKITANYYVADVSSADDQSRALSTIKAESGEPDMILYNAAAMDIKDILEQEWQSFQETLEVNLGGAFHLIRSELPGYLERNKGKLYFTGGGFALGGEPNWTTLTVGKAALRNLVQAAAKRSEGKHVHVAHLIICGFTNPNDNRYSPDAIAEQYWKLFNQKPGEYETEVLY